MWCETLLNQTGKITTIIFYFFKTGSLKNMESVGDLRLILEFFGHQNIKTTIDTLIFRRRIWLKFRVFLMIRILIRDKNNSNNNHIYDEDHYLY
ncbi:MAG: hypothetical protein KAG99_10800, partial [Bacteroidales bacterium]|nr:hypothetical protein [Bacteroidales bacterium]